MDTLLSYMTHCRNALHQIPELGNEEFKTSALIQKKLAEMQVPFEVVNDTGVIVHFKGKSPRRTVAFRADIDGLPISENSSHPHVSKHDGHMHACGHDGHMSMLLGLAYFLKNNTVAIVDDIVLIFQPAEEGPGGALQLIEAGVFERYGIDLIYGVHVMPSVAQGKIGICKGPAMAMVGEVDIDIIGTSAHGAMPHLGKDALLIGSECVMGLQSIVSRNVNPIEPAVLTVGKFVSGERRNIIAGSARLEATIRAFDEPTFERILSRMETYLKGVATAYEIDIHVEKRVLYPPVVNDATLYDLFYERNYENCEIMPPQMISEDFSYYQKKVPGFFYFIGTKNPMKNYVYPLHSDRFDFDDTIMRDGLKTYIDTLTADGSVVVNEEA